MNDIVLDGCRPEPLGSYLKGLGILRLVAGREGPDPDARGRWSPASAFVLSTSLDREALVSYFLDGYRPTPLVAPWNSGSGFRVGGKRVAAEQVLSKIERSSGVRLEPYRLAIGVGRSIVVRGKSRGWDDPTEKEFWRKDAKPSVLALCRAWLPDDALAWLDTSVVLGDKDEDYSPLLGSGGVLGSQELSVGFMQCVIDVLGLSEGRGAPGPPESRQGLESALFAEGRPRHRRGPVGQFDPGRAGGILSSPHESLDKEGFVNPWDLILFLEGAVLFASAASRRMGGSTDGKASLPFMVGASQVGYVSAATDERSRGELWAPLWDRPTGIRELSRLLGEGRAEWAGHQARSGLDFARAAASLGVDRGISAFARHAFVERHGQGMLAVPVGRLQVRDAPEVSLLLGVDRWLQRARGGAKVPAAIRGAMRAVDASMFDAARGGATDRPRSFQAVLVALADLELAVGRAGGFRKKFKVPPISALPASAWLPCLDDRSPEFRLAAALASGYDPPQPQRGQSGPADDRRHDGSSLRWMLRPVTVNEKGWLDWTERPPLVPGLGAAELTDVLSAALVRRMVDRVSERRSAEASGADRDGVGVRVAFTWSLPAHLSHIGALLAGEIDERRLGELLAGLMLLDWKSRPAVAWATADSGADAPPDPAWTILAPFFHGRAIRLPGGSPSVPEARLRPEIFWPAQLSAGRVTDVVERAVLRLRIAGLDPAVRTVSEHSQERGPRLAAALLCPVHGADLARIVARSAPPRLENGHVRESS